MTLLLLSPVAVRDVGDIWDYSAQRWSKTQADRYVGGLRDTLNLLCQTPHIAPLRRDIRPPVRLFPYRSHVVIYRSDEQVVDVLRVLHARADWRARML